ncbi:MAG TPA: hypothetical protein VLD61_03425 [Methylomirabilota bacterium]|nr:hypothetical protein [Methylomirabilota bacterium]
MKRMVSVWVVLVLMVAACATASLPPPRALQPGDLKILAGRWEGSGRTRQGRPIAATTWDVREDGTVVVNSGGRIADARLSIRDGKVVLDGAFSDAVLTLHEGAGRRVLRGTAQFRGAGGSGEADVELTQVR